MKDIEKTREHIEIITLLTPNKLLLKVVIGMNTTWHIELPMKANK
jgi:hypothetical protein